jgi:hypothetical protein
MSHLLIVFGHLVEESVPNGVRVGERKCSGKRKVEKRQNGAIVY